MIPTDDVCYRALKTRDARFDGIFFVAVRTTKIYCRPVCRVRPALRKNCLFLPSAAAAEAAGFRPCLRCRPELAPGSSSMEAVSRLAALAMQQIEGGALIEGSISDLADDFGVTDRHLRRVMRKELGVSPVEIAQTYRLLMARRLLTDTDLPVSHVARASGFSSLRRFHALFSKRYRLPPISFRKGPAPAGRSQSISCTLSYRPPYDWDAMLEFLGARAIDGVESVVNHEYARTVTIGGHTGTVCVRHRAERNSLVADVSAGLFPVLMPVLARLKNLFDLDAEPAAIAGTLGSLAARRPGLRVPGAFEGFEVGVRAILGQQISVMAATTLAGRFAAAFGEPLRAGIPGLSRLSPDATRVARASQREIESIGVTSQRARTIRAFTEACLSGRIVLTRALDVESQIAALVKLPGIGEWTAQYIAMRALGWPDAFPHTDLGIRKALKQKRPAHILTLSEKWRPWRSYAAMHLWKSLED